MQGGDRNGRLVGLVGIEEVAGMLGVGVRHVRRLVADRRIPYLKWGHLLRFDPVEIREWLDAASADPESLVFVGADGGALRANGWRARHWRPAIRAAGLEPLRPHDLRHTAVSLWVAAGASPKQIASWAGHTSVAVVLDRYGHLFPGHEDAVLDRLDGFAGNPSVTVTTAPEPLRPRGAAGFSRGEREEREPGSSRHSV